MGMESFTKRIPVKYCLIFVLFFSLVSAQCGNGRIQRGFPYREECDDGNTQSGDGCSATCREEAGWSCNGEPSVCSPICGDGNIRGLEECDDGNLVEQDGCDSLCRIEENWVCFQEPIEIDGDDANARKEGQGSVGAVVGGVVAVIAVIALLGLGAALFVFIRRRQTGSSNLSSAPRENPMFKSSETEASVVPLPTAQSRIFGVPLDEVKCVDNVSIVVEETVTFLEANGLNEEGILRLAGNTSHMKRMKDQYDAGQSPDFTQFNDVNSIGSCLKQYFRELPRPPIPNSPQIAQASESSDAEEMVAIMTEEVSHYTPKVYATLRRLFHFLHLVCENEHVNKMGTNNLAIVFGPTLKLKFELLAVIISNAHRIFP